MSAIILEYWRRVTFDFASPKGSTSGVFDVKVDSKGVPIVEKNSCIWKNVSGDSLTSCQYSPDDMAIQTANGGGAITDFSVALENTTYTISVGTWSYVNANVEGFTITATAGAGGSISPSGSVSVVEGEDQTFSFVASEGYAVSSVLVDGVSAGAVSSYTFSNVQADHTISASFEELATYDIEIEMDLTGEDFKAEFQKFIAGITVSGALNIVSSTYDVKTGTGTITIIETDTLPDNVFQSQTHITSIILPEYFEVIDDGAFAGCTSLRTITFPSSVTNFGTLVFDGCTSLGKIIMHAPTPPTIDGNDLGVDDVEVDVPEGAGQAYANALGWSDQEIVDPTPEPVYGFNLDKMVDTDYLMQGIMKK